MITAAYAMTMSILLFTCSKRIQLARQCFFTSPTYVGFIFLTSYSLTSCLIIISTRNTQIQHANASLISTNRLCHSNQLT